MQPQSGSWQYLLGTSIFVAAITEDVTRRTIDFPPGEWIDLWGDAVYPGPSTVEYSAPIDRYPIFFAGGTSSR
jgi:alpha-glucosidase (family GH31 glycosyl hydrolase)